MISIDTDLLRQALVKLKKERDNVGQAHYILGRLLADLNEDSDCIDTSVVSHVYSNTESVEKRLEAVFNLLEQVISGLDEFLIEITEEEQRKVRLINMFSETENLSDQ